MTAKSDNGPGIARVESPPTATAEGPPDSTDSPDPKVFRPECHQEVPIALLHVMPGRSPKIHSEGSVRTLAKEIEADGQIEALIICDHPTERGFQLVHGHRRLAALKLLGRTVAICDFKPYMTPEQADRVCFALQRERLSTWEMICDVRRRRVANPKATVEELSTATGYPRLRAMVVVLERVDPTLTSKLQHGECFDRLVECCRIEPEAHELIRYEAQQVYWAKGAPTRRKPCKPGLAQLKRSIRAIETRHRVCNVKVTPDVERAVLRLLRFHGGLSVGKVPQRGKRYRPRVAKAA